MIPLVCSLGPLLALIFLLAPPARGQAQPSPAGQSLDLCLGAAADGSCVYPTRDFRSPTTQVVAVFPVTRGEAPQVVARLTVLDVSGAIPANTVIATQTMQPSKDDTRGILTMMGPPLPTGKYRLDVTVGGKPWPSVEFRVTKAEMASDIRRPEDLLSLTTGKVWTYGLAQETGKSGRALPPGPVPGLGAKVDLTGGAPEAEKKYRATVTLTAVSADQAGTRIEVRRDGTPVFEEWWRLDEGGWATTQRKGPLGIAVVDPPQVLFPWPLKSPQQWTYEPKQRSFRLTSRLWGPVPVKGPQGETPGYVVLIEQPAPDSKTTVERHFLKGLGMVREVSITAVGAQVISRSELVLQALR